MPTQDRLLVLSSRSRKNTHENATKFVVHLDRSLDTQKIARVVLVSANFPHLFANVRGGRSRLHVEIGGTPYTLQIPEGHYDSAASLVAATQAALDGSGATTVSTITHDAFSLRVTIDTSGSSPVRILTHAEVTQKLNGIQQESFNTILGAPHNGVSTPSLVQTLPGVLDGSGVQSVAIHSNSLASGHSMRSDGQSTSCLAILPLNVPYGTIFTWRASDHLLSYVDTDGSHSALSSIDIELRDSDDQPLLLPENSNVELSLLIVFKDHEF